MTDLFPYRYISGRRRLCQCNLNNDGVAWHGNCEGRAQTWANGHQASTAQQADPEGSEQEDSELQGGVSVRGSQYGYTQLLNGEQEGE